MAKTPFKKLTNAHPHYWKVKAAFLESRQVAMDARARVDAANARLRQVMLDAGLDPAKHYHLKNDDESITLATPGESLPPV